MTPAAPETRLGGARNAAATSPLPSRKPRIVVAGAGIAGSLIATGLSKRPDVELVCLERAGETDHAEAGTGLNLGPNAMKCLAAFMPERAQAIRDNSLPWARWTIALTSGETLMDLDLAAVADNPGIRIRWAELYALLRAPIREHIRFGATLAACRREPDGRLSVTYDAGGGRRRMIDGVDLLVSAEGRYSPSRDLLCGASPPSFLGVSLYRLLFPAGPDCPIDDYGQWFNGPNRLLAFRVPGGFVYCAGSFPIDANASTPEAMKTADALAALYAPSAAPMAPEAAFLVAAIRRHVADIHWARLQDARMASSPPGTPVLLVGDAAHPMVPTLGQGATQAIEDACVAVAEIAAALDAGRPLPGVAAQVQRRRADRIRFVVDFSREATDTMLAGADPVAGTRRKTEPAFMAKLRSLYRDVPLPDHHRTHATQA